MKMNKIKLVYWNDIPNFGDALSPFIVHELSGKKIQHKFHIPSWKLRTYIKFIVWNLFKLRWKELTSILFPFESNIIAVGSVLSFGNRKSQIWGSGFMNGTDEFNGGKVLALRGIYSNEKLIKMGYKGTSIFGDPAILISLLIEPSRTKHYKIGLIPHWTETEFFVSQYSDKCKIIDLRTNDIKKVIYDITACEYILSTSLHGIIVSHAYGIPALWIKKNDINTDGIKFNDYFSSMNIPCYKGITQNIDELLLNITDLFIQEKQYALPHIDIISLQRELLKVCPFEIQKKYQNLVL